VTILRILKLGRVASETFSLLLTPFCCDDIHDVTPRVSAYAGCDNPGQCHVVLAGPNPEPMHEDFLATVYPQVHECFKHTDEDQYKER
ncbi:hypothetical protein Tco_1488615, partial [Tanacetum coccineum]